MSKISDSQALTLTRIGVLIGIRAEALSDFEAELCREVRARWTEMGRQTTVTEAEWPVLEASLKAMQAAALLAVPKYLIDVRRDAA